MRVEKGKHSGTIASDNVALTNSKQTNNVARLRDVAGLDGKGAAEGAKGSQQINRKSSENRQGEPRGAAEGAKGSQGEPRGASKSIA